MASLELRAVSEMLRARDFATAVQLGLNSDHLSGDPEIAQIYDFIRSWYMSPDTYREFPTMRAIKRRWPAFHPSTNKEDHGRLRTLIKECITQNVESDIRSLADYFQELVDDDPKRAVEIMQSHLARVSFDQNPSTGFSLEEIADSVEEQYLGAQSGKVFGIPWPWESLTADTLGINKEEFIVFYARAKSMKTWILLKVAMDCYFLHKRRVLLWSREMSLNKMALRSGSILAGVDYQCLKNGTLPANLYHRAIAALRSMSGALNKSKEDYEKIKDNDYKARDVPDFLAFCGRGAPRKLEQLDAIVEAFQPDVVLLDSMYHIQCAQMERYKSDHEQQRILSVELKQKAIDWGLPVIGTTQANREGEKTHGDTMADIGRTDSLSQEADLIVRLLRRRGRTPSEDEYEGHWDRLREKLEKKGQAPRRSGPRIQVGQAARRKMGRKSGKSSQGGLPSKIRDRIVEKLPEKERASAELYLMMSGTRDGILEGFRIDAIPGYKFDYVEDVTTEEVKKLFKEKEKEAKSESTQKRKDSPRVSPSQVGTSFS